MTTLALPSGAAPSPSLLPARPGAGWGRWLAGSVPALIELGLTVAAIAVLLPLFERVGHAGAGRDDRFLDRGVALAGLPDPVLPRTCDAFAAEADAGVRDSLCGARAGGARSAAPGGSPAPLARAAAQATRAFVVPIEAAERRVAELRAEAQAGDGALRDNAGAVAAIEADVAPFIARFRLSRGSADGPLPLRCASAWADEALARRPPPPTTVASPADGVARANAALLFGAALDGRAATGPAAAEAVLPAAPAGPGCAGPAEALGATAAVMADARQSLVNARKNEAMRALLGSAGGQWAAAMALGYAFLLWSRRARRPAFGVAAALAAWAGAAWLGRVPWPFAVGRDFVPARLEAGVVMTPSWSAAAFAQLPAPFVVALAAAALLVALVALVASPPPGAAPFRPAGPARSMGSRAGYAGWTMATGIGWLLLLDLSLGGHAGNRYLALYHQGHLWLAMLVLSSLVFVRRPLSSAFAWGLSVSGEAARRAALRVGTTSVAAMVAAATVLAVLAFGVALANMRQLTSELGRVWLIGGAAWFFFLRAGPLTERLARAGPAGLSFVRFAWPLLVVVGVLIAAMLVTHDMGPLLIAAYASGAFLAAALAMWWHHRSGRVVPAFALALLLFAAWIGAVTVALFQAGAVDSVTASRLESVAAPFASINDQLALVSWFQRAAPADGFGLGAAPWCGLSPGRGCSGVPAQIHSDYTFTALVGVFGAWLAWAVALGSAVWLHRLIRHHGRVTRGEPRFVGSGGRLANDGQALLSWIAVAWVVLTSCQLAVTVAGNLAVLPLTGVTFPFVSFGMTSLLVNAAFLALCLNVDLPGGGRGG